MSLSFWKTCLKVNFIPYIVSFYFNKGFCIYVYIYMKLYIHICTHNFEHLAPCWAYHRMWWDVCPLLPHCGLLKLTWELQQQRLLGPSLVGPGCKVSLGLLCILVWKSLLQCPEWVKDSGLDRNLCPSEQRGLPQLWVVRSPGGWESLAPTSPSGGSGGKRG